MALVILTTMVSANVAAAQGLYWESTTTGMGGQPHTAQFYAIPKMFKIVQSDGHTVILRVDQDKLFTVDNQKKTYREMSLAELESAAKAAGGQMEAARAQMQQRMKDLPPEQRAMMEKMMPNLPGANAAPVAVKNTGETKSISSYTCTKYVATEGDKTVLVAWTTKDVPGFAGLRDDWVKLQKRMASMDRLSGSATADAYAQIEGFPMETEVGQMKTVVTKVEARAAPASEFEVPAGYKQEKTELPKAPPR
jgi:GLPGLI family protein